MVDSDLRQGGPHLVEPLRRARNRPDPLGNRRVPLLDEFQQHGGSNNEHSCVPTESARRQITRRPPCVGLLDELDHRPAGRGACDAERHTLADVAEAGGGIRRGDPECDQVSGTRERNRLPHRRMEAIDASDDMVGGERPDHRVRVAGGDHRGRPGNRRHRVTGARLGQQVCRVQPRQLPGHLGRVVAASDDDDALTGQRRQSVPGRLEQRAPGPGEVVEELRGPAPGQRPQARASPTRRDDGPEPGDLARDAHGSTLTVRR